MRRGEESKRTLRRLSPALTLVGRVTPDQARAVAGPLWRLVELLEAQSEAQLGGRRDACGSAKRTTA